MIIRKHEFLIALNKRLVVPKAMVSTQIRLGSRGMEWKKNVLCTRRDNYIYNRNTVMELKKKIYINIQRKDKGWKQRKANDQVLITCIFPKTRLHSKYWNNNIHFGISSQTSEIDPVWPSSPRATACHQSSTLPTPQQRRRYAITSYSKNITSISEQWHTWNEMTHDLAWSVSSSGVFTDWKSTLVVIIVVCIYLI